MSIATSFLFIILLWFLVSRVWRRVTAWRLRPARRWGEVPDAAWWRSGLALIAVAVAEMVSPSLAITGRAPPPNLPEAPPPPAPAFAPAGTRWGDLARAAPGLERLAAMDDARLAEAREMLETFDMQGRTPASSDGDFSSAGIRSLVLRDIRQGALPGSDAPVPAGLPAPSLLTATWYSEAGLGPGPTSATPGVRLRRLARLLGRRGYVAPDLTWEMTCRLAFVAASGAPGGVEPAPRCDVIHRVGAQYDLISQGCAAPAERMMLDGRVAGCVSRWERPALHLSIGPAITTIHRPLSREERATPGGPRANAPHPPFSAWSVQPGDARVPLALQAWLETDDVARGMTVIHTPRGADWVRWTRGIDTEAGFVPPAMLLARDAEGAAAFDGVQWDDAATWAAVLARARWFFGVTGAALPGPIDPLDPLAPFASDPAVQGLRADLLERARALRAHADATPCLILNALPLYLHPDLRRAYDDEFTLVQRVVRRADHPELTPPPGGRCDRDLFLLTYYSAMMDRLDELEGAGRP